MPIGHRHQSGFDQAQPVHEGENFATGTQVQRRGGAPVHAAHGRRVVVVVLGGAVREADVAAGGEGVDEPGDGAGRTVLVGYEVQHGDEQYRHRFVEVQCGQYGRVAQDLAGPAQIALDDVGVRVAVEDEAAVRHGDGVDVDVHDPGTGRGPLGDLVHVADRRYPRPDVEELAHPGGDQPAHQPAEEGAVGAGDPGHAGHGLLGLPHQLAVHGEVVRAPQRVVVHARSVRLVDVDTLGCPGRSLHAARLLPQECQRIPGGSVRPGRPVTARALERRWRRSDKLRGGRNYASTGLLASWRGD